MLVARLFVALSLVFSAGQASAYVRSTSPKSGKAFSWMVSCLAVQADDRGSQDISLHDIDVAVARSVANWSDKTDTCSTLRMTALPAVGPKEVAADGHPVIVFRDEKWARPGGIPHDP